MSHEYPPLPEPAQGADDVFYIEEKDLFTADQLHSYAAPLLERIAELEGAVAAERERCAKLRALLDAVRLTVDPIAINENLRRNIQMALHETLDLGPNA